MFMKCAFYLLIINLYVCSTKADEYFKDLNMLLDRDEWKIISEVLKCHFVIERNADGQKLDVAELFKKDENNNEIITDENYKIKVQKLVLLYSTVHAIKLNKIIDVLRVFWGLCEKVEEKCKKLFLETLVNYHSTFVNMLNALSFIAKFKRKGLLIISDNVKNGVTLALNHLNVLSSSNSQDNECISFELKSAYDSIKEFFVSHIRPVPNYIAQDQKYLSLLYGKVKKIVNDNNNTLDKKLELLKIKLCDELKQYNYQHNKLGFRFYKNSYLVEVEPPENTIEPPNASDSEDEG